MDDLLRIGAFARLANVTVKTLRFYADEGLLPPYYVDPRSGYRYYAAVQIPLLTKILNLREVGFALSEIADLLDNMTEARVIRDAIDAQRSRLLAERALIEARLKVVDALAQSVDESGPGGLSRVRLTISEPQPAYTIRQRVDGLGEPVTQMFEQAEAEVAAHGARARRSPFLLFHSGRAEGGDLDLEVCIPVKERAEETLAARTVPGEDLSCSVIYTGPYDQTEPLRRRLTRWLADSGLQPRGPLREIYHRFGAREEGYSLPKHVLAADASDFVTELQIGVAPAADGPVSPTSETTNDQDRERKQ